MKIILLGTLAYVVVTFATQGVSHFAINQAHYAAVSFMRAEPVFALGFGSMIIQGAILTYLYPFYSRGVSNWRRGLMYGILLGLFFVSYLALAEPAKFQVPSISSWIGVETVTGMVQFGLFGIVVGAMHRKITDNHHVSDAMRSTHA
ncbi:MAG TPA: hypothetical protein VKC60_01680 [Opitutaceae bacterium]|nr:hypothetical protein [Opitutaceae bacterium]